MVWPSICLSQAPPRYLRTCLFPRMRAHPAYRRSPPIPPFTSPLRSRHPAPSGTLPPPARSLPTARTLDTCPIARLMVRLPAALALDFRPHERSLLAASAPPRPSIPAPCAPDSRCLCTRSLCQCARCPPLPRSIPASCALGTMHTILKCAPNLTDLYLTLFIAGSDKLVRSFQTVSPKDE
jgi:hypothetical protein